MNNRNNGSRPGFHGIGDRQMKSKWSEIADLAKEGVINNPIGSYTVTNRQLSYQFFTHFHPYVSDLVNELINLSVRGLQAADTDYTDATFDEGHPWEGERVPRFYEELFSERRYAPTDLVTQPYPVKDLDFTSSGAYSVYNWELFYHVPMTVAIHLSKNQQFEEAQRWFHYVFDPTDNSDGPTPERFWKVRPFHYTDVRMIEELLVNLSTGNDPQLREETINSIGAWKSLPFRPHVIARYRKSAYMYKAVMAYLDNLIDWGDSLFRQDTRESVNEAIQLYVLATNILGPRPQAVPKKGSVRPQTYANFRADLDKFGNVLRELETDIPFDILPDPMEGASGEDMTTLRSIGNALYFCVPRNEQLLGYWDTVADRLFKIRNSLNIKGIFRQLPFFAPPIDPGMLAAGAAAGLDVSAIVGGLNQPLPLVRFRLLLQKATEITNEVKSLGSAYLSALEKADNEALAILRARHETKILELTEVVRYGQWQEAKKSIEALKENLDGAINRYKYFETLLGTDKASLDFDDMTDLNLSALEEMDLNTEEQKADTRDIKVTLASEDEIKDNAKGKLVSKLESDQLRYIKRSKEFKKKVKQLITLAKLGVFIPKVIIKTQPFGIGADTEFDGDMIVKAAELSSYFWNSNAEEYAGNADKAAIIGRYERRIQEWKNQSNNAAAEISALHKQIRAAQIRAAVAEKELNNHKQRIVHAEEIEAFLQDERTGKLTNEAFYTWMKRELKAIYQQCYEFAFEIAKKSERALQHELGNTSLSYIKFAYLGGKEGLLAGEKLHLDLKRMEMAYHDLNQREYELTKTISLRQLDSEALLLLRSTGSCVISLPESLFDFDGPGHYFRRIRTVSLTIPVVTGPATSVNCTLTLLKSAIRTTPQIGDSGYARTDLEDQRFSDYYGSMQSVVTSTAQNDSGLFNDGAGDDRYLPFEYSGVVSEWRLELPGDPDNDEQLPLQFDYDTITDVMLTMRYTAREGGAVLKNAALANLRDEIHGATATGSKRLLSVRHEMPLQWEQFKNAAAQEDGSFKLSLLLKEEFYPYWSKGRLERLTQFALFADAAVDRLAVNDGNGNEARLEVGSHGKLLVGELAGAELPPPISSSPQQPVELFFDDNALEDLWVVLAWGAEAEE